MYMKFFNLKLHTDRLKNLTSSITHAALSAFKDI